MAGRLTDAWDYTWDEIWQPLKVADGSPQDVLMQLVSELAGALRTPLDPKTANDATNDADVAAETLQLWIPQDFYGDHDLARAFEGVYEVLDELDTPGLAREFYELTSKFLRCHNIRYRLVRPFVLRPTISGAFSNLVAQVEAAIAGDAHLQGLFEDFQYAIYQASRTNSESDIKTCIAKSSNLAEGVAAACPNANGRKTFGAVCNVAQCWPHEGVKSAFKNVYYFCSDFPGIRHAGRATSQLRSVSHVDGIVAALVLLSSTSYFLPNLDLAEIVG